MKITVVCRCCTLYIRTVSSQRLLPVLNLFMGCLGRASCTVHSISAQDQPARKQMYHYIREAKSLLYSYIYCALLEVAKKGVVTHLCSVACICGSNEGFVKLRTLGRWTQKQIESIFTLCKSASFSTKTTNSKMFPQILPFLKFFEINYFEVKEICISQSIALAFRLIYKPLQ